MGRQKEIIEFPGKIGCEERSNPQRDTKKSYLNYIYPYSSRWAFPRCTRDKLLIPAGLKQKTSSDYRRRFICDPDGRNTKHLY
jgi:hypothetical protein